MASTSELNEARLSDRYRGLDTNKINELPLRTPVQLAGEVQGIRVVPRSGSPSLEVTVADGSGRAVAVFLGRRRVPGLEPGRGVVLDGVARKEGSRTVLLNPAYTLIPQG